ncbi:isopentenyl-diphosphate Delta-isomerase [soil metagenome]
MMLLKDATLVQTVNDLGQTIGFAEKFAAHRDGGVFHRAVSVVLVDAKGNILLQRRAKGKYHFAGKWANACCTHPLPLESPLNAANRALGKELGIQAQVSEFATMVYQAHDPVSGYTEKEYDHIFVGKLEGQVFPEATEVDAVTWESTQKLADRMQKSPSDFVPWLGPVLDAIDGLTGLGRLPR